MTNNPLITIKLGNSTLSIRRSRFQISIDVLTAISHGEHRPTRLMYACNLSWKSMREILTLLEAKGYVDDLSNGERRKQYSITGKGMDVLGYYVGLQDLVDVSMF